MSQTSKYDLDLTDYAVTGWNGILKGSIEDIDEHLHTRISVTLGETVVIGNVVYLKSDGKYWKAKAVASQIPASGVAIEAGNADDSVRIQRLGPITVAGWAWTGAVGSKLYVNKTTAGVLSMTRPLEFAQTIGYILSATSVFLRVEEPSPLHFGFTTPPTPTGYRDGILYSQVTGTTTTTV